MPFRPQFTIRACACLLAALVVYPQVSAQAGNCVTQNLDAHLRDPQSFTWDERYPGNPIADVLDRILTGKITREAGHKELLNKVAASFEARGIKFKRVTTSDGHESLLILPLSREADPSAGSLNRLAAGILKYDPKYELHYTPAEITDSYVNGTFAQNTINDKTGHKSIEMSHAAAIEGSAKEQMLVHEVIHAKHFGDENRGKIHPYSVEAIANEPTKLSSILTMRKGSLPVSGSYSSFMKLDELLTFRHNLWKSARNYVEDVRRGQNASVNRIQLKLAINGNLKISRQAWDSVHLAKAALVELEKVKNFGWGKSTTFENAGIKYKGSIQFEKQKNGEQFARLRVEESVGFLSPRRPVISFALAFPIKDPNARKAGVPTALLHKVMDQLRATAKQNYNAAMQTQTVLEKLEKNAATLSPLERASLLQQIENLTRREVPEGYRTK